MSLAGDVSLVGKFRQLLRKNIQEEKDILVANTSERQAGRIQALQDVLVMLNTLVQQMTGDTPPPEEQ